MIPAVSKVRSSEYFNVNKFFHMTPIQDEAFTEHLRQKADEAKALGYHPTDFKKMLDAQGGEASVRQLLSKGEPSRGFTKLWELDRLDLSVEAIVVESQWRSFIDPMLLQHAEKLLRQSNYVFKAFPVPADPNASYATTGAAAVIAAPGYPPLTAAKLPEVSKRPRNTIAFSKFCASLGAPLANIADRWCGYNPQRGLAVFNLWADRLHGGSYLLWNDAVHSSDTRIGAKELRQVLNNLMAAGHSAYGILSEAVDIDASTRQRGYFDEHELLVLHLEARGPDIVAHVLGMVSAEDVASGHQGAVVPFDSAIDDLDPPPLGQAVPERTNLRGGTGYRRDPAVRNYVIQRSQGHCEYCGMLGFEMANGSFYVEAHHVIALSAQGPDTVDNVIALCSEHHRQAHYGKNCIELEATFLGKLRSLTER